MVFQKSKFEPNLNLALYDLWLFGPFVRSRLTLTNKNTVANIFTCHKNVRICRILMNRASKHSIDYEFGRGITRVSARLKIGLQKQQPITVWNFLVITNTL